MCLVLLLCCCGRLRGEKKIKWTPWKTMRRNRNMKPESFLRQRGLWLAGARAAGWTHRCHEIYRTRGNRPLHFRSSMTDSGCLFSISLRLSSNWTPSVGRRRFWTTERTELMSTDRTDVPLPFPTSRASALLPETCCCSSLAASLPAALSLEPLSSASRVGGTCQAAGRSAAAWHPHKRKGLSPWSAPPQRPSRSRHLQPQREGIYRWGGPQVSQKHLNTWGIKGPRLCRL